MKNFLITIFLLLITEKFTFSSTFNSPDIIIDSKLDYNWSGVLITKIRQLLKNYKLSDPFSYKFKENVLLNSFKMERVLPEESKLFIKGLGSSVGLNFIESETSVWIENFGYHVSGLRTDLLANEHVIDGLIMSSEFSANELNLTADKMTLSLAIPGMKNPPIFNVDIIRPVVNAKNEKLITFFAKLKIMEKSDSFNLKLLKANFENMAQELLSNYADVTINYESVIIPQTSLKIGSKTIHFSPEKIGHLIRQNHSAIKGILLALAADFLRTNTEQAARKLLDRYKFNKEYWISSSVLQGQILIKKISGSIMGDSMKINMPGDFCTNEKFNELKQACLDNKNTKVSDSKINLKSHEESLKVMKDLMQQGEANFVASISEDYVNKLLITTFDAGLWNQTLNEAGIKLGPGKVAMRLNKKGDYGTLFMDVIYKPTKLEKAFIGSSEVRFPLVLDLSLRIENQNTEPVMIIHLNEADVSDDTIINGRPEEGMMSNIKDIPRFKRKIAKAIRERLVVLKNNDIIELRFPELQGLSLDKVNFLSDGRGRMNAVMRLEDLIEIDPEFKCD